MNTKIIAFYLPQYHPFKENNEWWGAGFTEWTNVTTAQPLFKGHYQPKIPKDLGFYDLRLPESREEQIKLAQEAGVYGFCYWHYWFGKNKELMERPFNEVVSSGVPDFPFCIGWANESWLNKQWNADGTLKGGKLLIEQKYEGLEDYKAHFNKLLPAFKDKRYILIDNCPLVFIHRAILLPTEIITIWNQMAQEHGFSGIYFVGRLTYAEYMENKFNLLLNKGFNAITIGRLGNSILKESKIKRLTRHLIGYLKYNGCTRIASYDKEIQYYSEDIDKREDVFPAIYPNWDHSPRSKKTGLIINNSTPQKFYTHVKKVLSMVKNKKESHKIIFLKSWNEWGEGNYMEPDIKFGKGYIEYLRKTLEEND